MMTTVFVLSALLFLYTCCVLGQSQCRKKEQCLPIAECPALLTLTKNINHTDNYLQIWKWKSCGTTETNGRKVCCPSVEDNTCFTPDENIGKCIDVQQCEPIRSIIRKWPTTERNRRFVKNSMCEGPSRINVCCGPKINDIVTRRAKTCEPTAMPREPLTGCCGISSSSFDKIFGGSSANIDQHPWVVIIEYLIIKSQKIKLLCGGSLISHKYVLTAAHCVTGQILDVAKPINVRLGEYDTATDGPDCVTLDDGEQDCTDGAVGIPIESIIVHKNYNQGSLKQWHDIALIRLKELAPYTDFIRPICLPTKNTTDEASGQQMIAAGWGAVSNNIKFSNVKQNVELPLISIQECQKSYDVDGLRVKLWKGQLCAGGVAGKDACRGDSGGPLMTDNGRFYTVDGVVSFGSTPCGMEDVPGVYTKVYKYMPWIRTHMKP